MNELSAKKCAPCEGGVAPLSRAEAAALCAELHPDWQLAADAKSLKRAFKFKDFYRTMSFVNALAHIANWKTTTLTWKSVTTTVASPTRRIRSAACRRMISSAPPRSIVFQIDRDAAGDSGPAASDALRLEKIGNVADQPQGALRELPFEEWQFANRIESGRAQPRDTRVGIGK